VHEPNFVSLARGPVERNLEIDNFKLMFDE
jgi:hypothetical protein